MTLSTTDRLAVAITGGVWLTALPQVTVVGSVSDGVQALDAIEGLRPDVVLLDIQMPGKSGMAVAADLEPQTRPPVRRRLRLHGGRGAIVAGWPATSV